jgi:uncharacterized protein YdaU (DUF1376 family)
MPKRFGLKFPLFLAKPLKTMNNEELGTYVTLLRLVEEGHGSIPDDDKEIARFLELKPKEWAKHKPKVLSPFTLKDGRWHHDREHVL